MLFSEANLESDMEVGFKGNPNIGSVVLNQFTDSQDFIDFADAFKPGDRIFTLVRSSAEQGQVDSLYY